MSIQLVDQGRFDLQNDKKKETKAKIIEIKAMIYKLA